ncbi:MAG: ATP-dependent DNA helicase RecG [Oscillospiraceae bacterium]|nr:ATP-dependent DNA helicase RecG [Oscillospiraceae bacterium]
MPNISVNVKITELKGIGAARSKAFARLGLEDTLDLLRCYPADYEDRTVFAKIRTLIPGHTCCVRAMIADEPRESRIRNGLTLTKLTVVDETGRLFLTFFNSPYVKQSLVRGKSYVFYGKAEFSNNRTCMTNPVFETESRQSVTGRIVPIYGLTKGLSQYNVRSAVTQALECHSVPDGDPLRQIHAPDNMTKLQEARNILAYNELYALALRLAELKAERAAKAGNIFPKLSIDEFENTLPFTLTAAQKRAMTETDTDISNGSLMARLVQGDVGSGKTMVAAYAALRACRGGYQAALMAPTELLASQHYATLKPLMDEWGVSSCLLTGRITPANKAKLQREIADGKIDFIVGTHALISKNTAFSNLALIITDEQHRFGVSQRETLQAKGNDAHTLYMSATPIPRTLALLLYGELDVSVIDELPPGRTPVKTYAVNEAYRERIDGFIRKTVDGGGQVFIVCPSIESPDFADAVSVHERLSGVFTDMEIGLAHGKLKQKDRAFVMDRFSKGEIPILVATTVIEVGVDVPNAALMVVESAERFGLAQLHQLRGRVGRGRRESFCVLFNSTGGEQAAKRLKTLEKSNDGFEIAEIDLQMRGSGDFFGTRQHGLPELNLPRGYDISIIKKAREDALRTLGGN